MNEIEEAFEYLASHPGALTFSECKLIEQCKKIYQEKQTLSEGERESLLSLRNYRAKKENSIKG